MELKQNAGSSGVKGKQDNPEWDYANDLDQIKTNLNKSSREDQEKVRTLIATCLKVSKGFRFDSTRLQKDVIPAISIGDIKAYNTNNPNPLKLELILNEVLSYLPVSALLDCRLVNGSWNSSSFAWIQNKVSNRQQMRIPWKSFPKFYEDFANAEVLLLPNLEIELDRMDLKYCSQFFIQHGSRIQSLTIERMIHLSRPSDEYLKECVIKLRNVFRNVPNLNGLSLDLGCIPDVLPEQFIFEENEHIVLSKVKLLKLSSMTQLSQEFLTGLFAMLPNLKTLRLGHSLPRGQNLDEFFKALQKLNLENFKCRSCPTFLQQVTMKGYPRLKELSTRFFNCSSHNLRIDLIYSELLKFLSCSLEVLKFQLSSYSENMQDELKLRFPIMSKLTTLELKCEDDNDYNQSFGIASIESDELPELKTLCLSIALIRDSIFTDSIFTSVQEINILLNGDQRHGDIDKLLNAEARFPNLKKLTNLQLILHPSIEEMAEITRNLSDVEELEINIRNQRMKTFNLVFNGIPLEWGRAISELTDRGVSSESLLSWINPIGPSFRDLRGLKRLLITFLCGPREHTAARIDEISVYLTFLRLNPDLHLTFRGYFSIRAELAAKLTAHFRNLYFKPEEGYKFQDSN